MRLSSTSSPLFVAGEQVEDAADQLEDRSTFSDSEGFTEGLAADSETGDEGGNG